MLQGEEGTGATGIIGKAAEGKGERTDREGKRKGERTREGKARTRREGKERPGECRLQTSVKAF